jgi:hypothetical protein
VANVGLESPDLDAAKKEKKPTALVTQRGASVNRVVLRSPYYEQIVLKASAIDLALRFVIIPLLFALLGTLAAAIRSLNDEFKGMTLTELANTYRRPRVLLGMVGGAIIGIIFSAEKLEGVSGLTLIGLAFVVGYAVDLLFDLLDSIKLRLGDSPAPKS